MPSITDFKQDSDLTMDGLFKVKSKLNTEKSPGLNGLSSEQLKLTAHMLNLLSPTKFGLRVGYSSEQAILPIRHCVQLAIDKNKPIVLIFVGLKKAFDSLPSHAIIKQFIDLRCS
ncbi:hypothetical protein ACTXT7_013096 [Hymenolepis weldensis]